MSIRNVFHLTTIIIFALAAATVGALLKATHSTQSLSVLSTRHMQSVRASEELQVALLRYSRENLLSLYNETTLPKASRLKLESEVKARIAEVKGFVETDEENKLVGEIKRNTTLYFDFHDKIAREDLPRDFGPKALPQILDRAITASDKLADVNLYQANTIEKEIQAATNSAVRTTVRVGILSLLFILFIWLVVHQWIYRPVALLSENIDSFSGSDLNRRLLEKGPKEARAISSAFNRLSERIMSRRDASLRFLAAVAHDLRNPLSAIRMSSELLKDDHSASTENRTIFDVISRQTQHLDRMVGDLLDTTRIESGQLELKKESLDLTGLVKDSGLLHKSISSAHNIEILVPQQPVVCSVDSLRVSQVLNNLLNNAIKYSPDGGQVIVHLFESKKYAIIEVSDQGIGIAQSDVSGIFEPFRRSVATRGTIPGVGLGLSVAKRIIEAHDGKIEVVSSPGRGSTFRVHIPLQVSHSVSSNPSELASL